MPKIMVIFILLITGSLFLLSFLFNQLTGCSSKLQSLELTHTGYPSKNCVFFELSHPFSRIKLEELLLSVICLIS